MSIDRTVKYKLCHFAPRLESVFFFLMLLPARVDFFYWLNTHFIYQLLLVFVAVVCRRNMLIIFFSPSSNLLNFTQLSSHLVLIRCDHRHLICGYNNPSQSKIGGNALTHKHKRNNSLLAPPNYPHKMWPFPKSRYILYATKSVPNRDLTPPDSCCLKLV